MKIIKWFKKQSFILKITYITLVVSIIMFVLYFFFVRGHFSSDSREWANFGAYFGSITGLLAFVGVLYTASLSEERAIKAEQELLKREQRDQFFKMLELLREELKKNSNEKRDELDILIKRAQNHILEQLVLYFVQNIKYEEWLNFVEDYHSSPESKQIGSIDFLDKVTDVFIRLNKLYKGSKIKIEGSSLNKVDVSFIQNNLDIRDYRRIYKNSNISVDKDMLRREDIDKLFKFLEKRLEKKTISDAIECTSRYFYSSLNEFSSYCKYISLIIETINQFLPETTEFFYKILSSQLKSNELIIFYLYLFSDNFDSDRIDYYAFRGIYANLCYRDFIIIDRLKYKSQEDSQLSAYLVGHFKKHHPRLPSYWFT